MKSSSVVTMLIFSSTKWLSSASTTSSFGTEILYLGWKSLEELANVVRLMLFGEATIRRTPCLGYLIP